MIKVISKKEPDGSEQDSLDEVIFFINKQSVIDMIKYHKAEVSNERLEELLISISKPAFNELIEEIILAMVNSKKKPLDKYDMPPACKLKADENDPECLSCGS